MRPGLRTIPRLSVIIPARNEEANIAACVRSLLAQGPALGNDLEIIVADDGSEDRTAAIARELAGEHPGVKLISVPPLPAGWLGKAHALHTAVEQARGEWLLFTDADTRHEPRTLTAVIQRAEKENLDLVSFSPRQETRTWWEKAVIPLVFQELARLYPFSRVNDPNDPLAAANGQYILIRRRAYQAVGGHQAVRNEVLEDVELARLAKQAGFRIWFGSGEGIVTTRMYRRFSEMWPGWTKNLFLLYDQDSGKIGRAAAELACRYLLPAAAGSLLLSAGSGWTAGVGAALLGYLAWEHFRYWRRLPAGTRTAATALLLPGTLLFLLLLWNSARWHCRRQEIEWKGRRYRARDEDLPEAEPLMKAGPWKEP